MNRFDDMKRHGKWRRYVDGFSVPFSTLPYMPLYNLAPVREKRRVERAESPDINASGSSRSCERSN